MWINGCVFHKSFIKKDIEPKTMMDVYDQSTGQAKEDVAQFIEKNLKEQKTFGYVKPYIPVVKEPVVRKVWIPDHKSEDADVMIAGHWNYVMIQPAKWFIDENISESKVPIVIAPIVESDQE